MKCPFEICSNLLEWLKNQPNFPKKSHYFRIVLDSSMLIRFLQKNSSAEA